MSESSLSRALPDSSGDWRELVAVILMSVTTVLTAWTAFQASKWSGDMSISFNQASAARVDAGRYEGEANRQSTIQVSLYISWVQAQSSGDRKLADYMRANFPEPLASAMNAWVELEPLTNLSAPKTPFEMPEYVQLSRGQAVEAVSLAQIKTEKALESNKHSDNYTVLTILFATVLFFGAVSGRVRRTLSGWILIGTAAVIFIGASSILVTFPKLF